MAIHHWWGQVMRGFFAWRRRNIRITKGCSPGQMVRPFLNSQGGEGRVHFGWSAKGKASYKAQWDLMQSHPDGLGMLGAGHDAVWRSAQASWFEWLKGSAPFLKTWSEAYQRDVRNRQQHFLTGPLSVFMKPKKRHREAASYKLMRKMVVQVRKRGYVIPEPVVSGTHYFSLPKGLENIRMVYNGSSCGLNDVLWAPRFGLLMVKQTQRALLPGYIQCDLDGGGQFPNYYLHEELCQ